MFDPATMALRNSTVLNMLRDKLHPSTDIVMIGERKAVIEIDIYSNQHINREDAMLSKNRCCTKR